MAKERHGSFNPENWMDGGGLLNGVEVEWKGCKYVMFDYDGKQDPTPAFRATLVADDGEESIQHWSCGNPDDWNPDKTGNFMEYIGPPPKDPKQSVDFRKSCNFVKLVNSFIQAGVSKTKLGEADGAADFFNGFRTVIVQQPQMDFDGKPKQRKGKDGKMYPATLPVVDKIVSAPWDKPSGKGAAGKSSSKAEDKGEGKGEGKDGGDSDLNDLAMEAITSVLPGAKKGMTKMQLLGQTFTFLKDKLGKGEMTKVNSINTHIRSSKLLEEGAEAGMWTWDGEIIKPA